MKNIALWLIALTFSLIVYGCGGVNETSYEAEASIPEGFKFITTQEMKHGIILTEIIHIESNCHYLIATDFDATSLEQMHIEKNGVSVPYCDGGNY